MSHLGSISPISRRRFAVREYCQAIRSEEVQRMFINASEYLKDRVQCSYGATFTELRIHRRTQEILVHQVVGAYSFGAILNSKAARSQLMGAQIFGSSSAMPEATQSDKRSMRYTNDNLAKYMIRVSADIARHEVTLIPKKDFVINYLGIKSVGGWGNSGVNAPVVNTVFHAWENQIYELPIRLKQLL
jgi:xanthine dehydrogenase YagR molybdenum-binding subunit